MRVVISTFLVLALTLSAGLARASEDSEAEALATAGEEFLAKGSTEKARDYLFKALFHSDRCPIALYDLGKMLQAEGNNVAASQFLEKAYHEMKNLESSRPEYTSKISDAKMRLQAVNVYAGQFNTAMEDYAQDLSRTLKKNNDSLTNDSAAERIQSLSLASYVAANKLPEIQKTVAKADPSKPVIGKGMKHSSQGMQQDTSPSDSEVTTVVPPAIERALKAQGWDTIKGVWKEKSTGVYEVTDGKLEANKTNGGIQFAYYPSGTGTVSCFVRNGAKDPFIRSSGSTGTSTSGSMINHLSWATGYGVTLNDREGKVYSPNGGMGAWGGSGSMDTYPSFDHNFQLTPGPQHLFSITVADQENGKATFFTVLIDGSKKEINTHYKIPKDGPMTIIIKGTVTLGSPQAGGQ